MMSAIFKKYPWRSCMVSAVLASGLLTKGDVLFTWTFTYANHTIHLTEAIAYCLCLASGEGACAHTHKLHANWIDLFASIIGWLFQEQHVNWKS